MDAAQTFPINSQLEFGVRVRECIARSHASLQLFDPDFRVFPLGLADVDAALRGFLKAGGSLRLAMHRGTHLERECPRFLRLLRDYGHRIECRVTSKHLQQLTDSFCIGDRVHIVRRFHSDHIRGMAAFDAPAATELSLDRFEAIWVETVPGLHGSVTGL
jgi:hypothetical protein